MNDNEPMIAFVIEKLGPDSDQAIWFLIGDIAIRHAPGMDEQVPPFPMIQGESVDPRQMVLQALVVAIVAVFRGEAAVHVPAGKPVPPAIGVQHHLFVVATEADLFVDPRGRSLHKDVDDLCGVRTSIHVVAQEDNLLLSGIGFCMVFDLCMQLEQQVSASMDVTDGVDDHRVSAVFRTMRRPM